MNMKNTEWKISKHNVFLFTNIVIYLSLSAFFFQKSMFDGAEYDGFYSQILYVVEGDGRASSPLYPVHLLRYFVVSPFYYIYNNGLPKIYESFLVMLFLMPVLTAKFNSRKLYSQVFFIYLPILFSYRSVLAMCAISYLFICLHGDKKSYFMLLLSMFLANLSSGVVLPWVLIVIMNVKQLSYRYKYVRVVILCAIIVLGFSVIQKIEFFYNEFSSGTTLIQRSTFYVSFVNQQYSRLTFYVLLFSAWSVISLAKLRFKSFSWQLYTFYLPVFITFLFEGIGLISFIIPMFWFFMGVRPSFKNYGLRWHDVEPKMISQ